MFALAINRRFWLSNAGTFAWSITKDVTFGHSSTFCVFFEPTSTCKHECNSSTKFSTMDAHDSCLPTNKLRCGTKKRRTALTAKGLELSPVFWRQRFLFSEQTYLCGFWTQNRFNTKVARIMTPVLCFYLDFVFFFGWLEQNVHQQNSPKWCFLVVI